MLHCIHRPVILYVSLSFAILELCYSNYDLAEITWLWNDIIRFTCTLYGLDVACERDIRKHSLDKTAMIASLSTLTTMVSIQLYLGGEFD